MNDILLDLPADKRARLNAALEHGQLDLTSGEVELRAALGRLDNAAALAAALRELHDLGMSTRGAAAALRAIDRVTARQRKPDLVLSGLQVPGIYARDTSIVYNELLGNAERSVWLSSFVYYDVPSIFATLAQRMEQQPQLNVTLLLNIQRRWGDTTASDVLVRAFAVDFWRKAWPGTRRPRVYYDPRSLSLDASERAVLHAKAVVVDDERLFITSANLTAVAGERNIEIGVLLRDRSMALSVVAYFKRLIDERYLHVLPE